MTSRKGCRVPRLGSALKGPLLPGELSEGTYCPRGSEDNMLWEGYSCPPQPQAMKDQGAEVGFRLGCERHMGLLTCESCMLGGGYPKS